MEQKATWSLETSLKTVVHWCTPLSFDDLNKLAVHVCAVTTHLGQTCQEGWQGDGRGAVVPSPAAEEPQRVALLARVRAALGKKRRRVSFKYITMVT